jgi:hypothetical protein
VGGVSADRRVCEPYGLQRVQTTLFHHGIAAVPAELRSAAGRGFLEALELPVDARERIAIALTMIDSLDGQLRPLESELRKLARRQTGCRALMRSSAWVS